MGRWLQKTCCWPVAIRLKAALIWIKPAWLANAIVLMVLVTGFLLGGSDGSLAAGVPQTYREPLTRELLTLKGLEARLAEPASRGGMRVVDLRNFTIDLREDQSSAAASSRRTLQTPSDATTVAGRSKQRQGPNTRPFSERFYQRLQAASNGPQPIGLDLGNALIQGNLDLSRLSLRVSPYGGPVLPALEAFNQAAAPYASAGGPGPLGNPSLRGPTRTEPLLRSLLIKPKAVAMDAFAFQGPLLLEQTCFNGTVTAANLYFLNRLEAPGVVFTQPVDWQGAHFARSVDFSQGQFQQESTFRMALFAARAKFSQARFTGPTDWEGATFHQAVSFAGASFKNGDFSRSHWQANADFEQAGFHEPITFQKSRFDQSLFLTDAQFAAAANFRQAQFQSAISLRGAHILNQLDFGDARFAKATTINVADLDFNAGEAKILGSPGYIGRVFLVPALARNETVLRNLVRNFRLLEQVSDANQVEYTTERLRLKGLKRQMLGLGLNQASATQLMKLGLSANQAAAVVARVQAQPLVSRTDLLGLAEIDLASYLKVRDRVTTKPTDILHRTQRFIRWLLLAGLLLLSQYGTNVGLTFGVGLLATTAFAVIFWIVDRYRRQVPTPIVPTQAETVSMALGSAGLFFLSLTLIGQGNLHPGWTLLAVAFVVLPVPLGVMARLYQQGRYHDLMDRSYFVENGALRRLQVLIARLPTVPKYPFYRDRYSPLLIDRQWNWLNYFDFSLNNWFKFGFNDIRLRDKAVPGLISTLVWYQWGLGVAYIALLLWTLSRTIPGLNLLLYF